MRGGWRGAADMGRRGWYSGLCIELVGVMDGTGVMGKVVGGVRVCGCEEWRVVCLYVRLVPWCRVERACRVVVLAVSSMCDVRRCIRSRRVALAQCNWAPAGYTAELHRAHACTGRNTDEWMRKALLAQRQRGGDSYTTEVEGRHRRTARYNRQRATASTDTASSTQHQAAPALPSSLLVSPHHSAIPLFPTPRPHHPPLLPPPWPPPPTTSPLPGRAPPPVHLVSWMT